MSSKNRKEQPKGVHLALDEKMVDESKYPALPKRLVTPAVTDTDGEEQKKWFDWRGGYHPIAMFDENKRFVGDKNRKVAVRMTLKGTALPPFETLITANGKGRYWLSAFDVFIPGSLLLEFTAVDSGKVPVFPVKGYSVTIPVVAAPPSKAKVDASSSSSSSNNNNNNNNSKSKTSKSAASTPIAVTSATKGKKEQIGGGDGGVSGANKRKLPIVTGDGEDDDTPNDDNDRMERLGNGKNRDDDEYDLNTAVGRFLASTKRFPPLVAEDEEATAAISMPFFAPGASALSGFLAGSTAGGTGGSTAKFKSAKPVTNSNSRNSSSSSSLVPTEGMNEAVAVGVATLKMNVTKKKNIIGGTAAGIGLNSTGSLGLGMTISANTTADSAADKLTKGDAPVTSIEIKGPCFTLQLPIALAEALMRDREVNVGLLCEYLGNQISLKKQQKAKESTETKKQKTRTTSTTATTTEPPPQHQSTLLLPPALKSPSVADLFDKLLQRVESRLPPPLLSKKRAATGVSTAPSSSTTSSKNNSRNSSAGGGGSAGGTAWRLMVTQLFHLFEHFFVDYVLYPEEKELLGELLHNWKSLKVNYAEEFGSYYFLRFLVLIATGATETDVSYAAAGGGSGVPVSSAYVAMQDLLQVAFYMLNEQPTLYFY